MKWSIILLPVLLASCRSQPEKVVDFRHFFITGTYVAYLENPFIRTWDTLVITTLAGHNHFQIIRNTSFQRHRDNLFYPPEFQQERWEGEYNFYTKRLIIEGSPNVLEFDPIARSGFQMNQTEYHKIEK